MRYFILALICGLSFGCRSSAPTQKAPCAGKVTGGDAYVDKANDKAGTGTPVYGGDNEYTSVEVSPNDPDMVPVPKTNGKPPHNF